MYQQQNITTLFKKYFLKSKICYIKNTIDLNQKFKQDVLEDVAKT